ncbi:hypothetical protein FOE78_05825 [Microlunatus elymi]|uniref:Type I phosphodiesterase / nucleotide pyrophosphatase n=2 Tax=Microlunatus elymi TaxID=2596828 RepID=A0A516PWD5_9ACTN|nr:hypothetical protein FOE78_05825 [Microlunatus elymi]
MFADGGFVPVPSTDGESPEGLDALDEQVTRRAEEFIAGHDSSQGSLLVCYLGAPDEIAHAHGTGPLYDESIARADARVVRLLAAIGARPEEEWTVIAVTDHGHVDAGGHGGDSDEERTAWIAARGPFTRVLGTGVVPEGLEQADVAAHAMATLRINDAAWAHMTGRPFDLPRASVEAGTTGAARE